MEFPFKSTGSAVIKPIVSEESDKFLAVASLKALSKFIPGVDTTKHVDFLPIAFDAFVANRVNNNDDVSNSAISVEIAEAFLYKPINLEHNRQHLIGVVTNYAFTKFGSHESFTRDEALATTDPFNVTLGGLIWRVSNPKLAKFIEECSDPTSKHYQEVSASWEIGFLDYVIAAIEGDSRNLADATIITKEDEINQLKGYMRAFGGKGQKGEVKLYRLIKGSALPLGIGLTGTPAADVAGVATPVTNEVKAAEITAKLTQTDASLEVSASKLTQSIENISQTNENIVIQERNEKPMSVKITKLEDITDDNLKQASASQVTEFVKEQIKLADEAFKKEQTDLQNQVTASKQAAEKLQADFAKLQEEFKKTTEVLATLNKEKEARARQDTFNARMLSLDKIYTLGDAEREIIASDIANLDDAGFEAYKKKLTVLLASKVKTEKKEEKTAPTIEAKASTDTKSTTDVKATVETAIDNADKNKEIIVGATNAQEPSILDRAAKAFGLENWISDIKLSE